MPDDVPGIIASMGAAGPFVVLTLYAMLQLYLSNKQAGKRDAILAELMQVIERKSKTDAELSQVISSYGSIQERVVHRMIGLEKEVAILRASIQPSPIPLDGGDNA